MPTTIPLQYKALGNEHRRTIVFLHGLLGRATDFQDSMRLLASRYRVIAPEFPIDRPELAKTDGGSIEILTDSLHDLLKQLKLGKVTLCGHSLGGQVAIDYCLKYPDELEGLVLTASAGLFEQNVSRGVRPHPCPKYVREIGKDIFYNPIHITDRQVDYTCKLFSSRDTIRFLIRLAKATRDQSVRESLSRIGSPVLIIWGNDDIITPPFVGEEFRKGIKDARIRIFNQCGHAPPVEHPKAFAAAIGEFLDAMETPVGQVSIQSFSKGPEREPLEWNEKQRLAG